ncbi:MAG: ABC transporter permease [Thomasclavelia sp.]|uniref:ABC transporter permease n=1 Tax=Thomasclavelia sp. TaxID=3025757 RepID=UPI0039A2EC5C
MKTFKTMLKTELKLSLRGMDMVIFAICLPLIILFILGIIYGNKPAFDGANYTFLEQSFGALSTISICAGGVMGLPLVISDYRSKNILKRYRVTPISPGIILIVQVTIYILYAVISFILLYLTATIFFGFQFHGHFISFLGGYLLVIGTIFSIGMMVGGIAHNTKTAGIIASILYFPMLIFSGATLPYEIMPVTLQQAADILPLTQGIKILKAATLNIAIENIIPSIIVMIFIVLVCTWISLKFFKWE